MRHHLAAARFAMSCLLEELARPLTRHRKEK